MTRRQVIMGVVIVGLLALGFWAMDDSPSDNTVNTADTAIAAKQPARVAFPPINLGKASMKEAVLGGKSYKFVERQYTPPLVLPQYSQHSDSDISDTPEAALAAYASAMQRADWDAWLSMWDSKSQTVIYQWAEFNNGQPGPADYKERMLEGWKRFYSGVKHELVTQIQIPGYTLVYMRRVGQPDDSRDLLAPVVMKQENNRWVMTHDLQEHIVPNLRITDRDVQVRSIL